MKIQKTCCVLYANEYLKVKSNEIKQLSTEHAQYKRESRHNKV